MCLTAIQQQATMNRSQFEFVFLLLAIGGMVLVLYMPVLAFFGIRSHGCAGMGEVVMYLLITLPLGTICSIAAIFLSKKIYTRLIGVFTLLVATPICILKYVM